MFFTREDILKIQNALLQLSVKDSELPSAEPVTYDNTLSIVQDGKNKQIKIEDFFNQISLWKREDFINITDKYDEHYISLIEAIKLVPVLQKKDGLVITFQDIEGNWEIYQFRGNITEFFNIEKWFNLYDYRNNIVKSIVPDEEDLTASTPDENGNSLVSLKDRVYDPTSFSGKGYKILRKNIVNGVNILTQEMMSAQNTKYIIKYDYILGENIDVPENCILEFDGGSISASGNNNTITGNNTGINASLVKIFNIDIILAGTFKNGEWNIEWFGADYSALNNDIIINFAIEQIYNIGGGTLKLNHDITISDTIWLMSGVSLLGTSLNTKTNTWWPTGGTNIRCCFANKNKWAISVKAKNNVIIPYNVLDITDYDTYSLDGIRIENLVVVLVKDDGTDPKTYELEPIFGGVRLKNFTYASLKQVDIFGFKYGLAISFSWVSSINSVHSCGKSVGLYLGSTITTLTFNSCAFSRYANHHILGNQDVDFQLFNATTNLIPSYIEQNDIKSIGIVVDKKNNTHAACCTFVGCIVEGYNIAASISCGRHNFISLYIENIDKTVVWARNSSINISGETYSLFTCIPIIEDGYEFGGIYSSFNISNFPTSRCYNGERCFYTVNGNNYPNEISFYDRYYRDKDNNLVFEKNQNKKIIGIPNVLSVMRDSVSPSTKNVVTEITAIGSGMRNIVMSEVSKRAKEIDVDTIVINLTQYLYMTPPSEPIENKNVFIKATFDNINMLRISSLPFKNSNIFVKDDVFIDTNKVTFNIFGKCNINLYAWIIQTHLINLSGNEPIELNITFRNSGSLSYATRDRIINNPSFECPYIVRIFNSDGTLYTTFTNPSKPTKSVPIGYVYIENGVPIYYTGDTSNGKSGWVNSTGTSV